MTVAQRDKIAQDGRKIMIRLEFSSNRAMAALGLTFVQANVLLYILEHSDRGVSLTELHRELGYSMAAVSCLVKRLREKGCVRSEIGPGDNRLKLLFATQKGEECSERLKNVLHRINHRLFGGFTESELSALFAMNQKMLENLETMNWEESES